MLQMCCIHLSGENFDPTHQIRSLVPIVDYAQHFLQTAVKRPHQNQWLIGILQTSLTLPLSETQLGQNNTSLVTNAAAALRSDHGLKLA
jgi:hypothetical protein